MLAGRTALVTGSTSGIGLAVARALARAGAKVMLNGSRPAADAEALRAGLAAEMGVEVGYTQANLALGASARGLVEATIAAFGGVDILVNNAGIQHVAAVDAFPDDTWDQLIAINLSSVFHTTKAALPSMKARGWGRIVNIASAHGVVASPFKAPYTASKHAVVGFSKAVALEVAEQGITCNALCPGYVRTPLVEKQVVDQAKVHNLPEDRVIREVILAAQPTKQFVEADEVAAFTVFLCSDAARSVTGSVQLIDGGLDREVAPGKAGMEEFIGGLWHRFITRAATRSHPEAVVRLADMERSAGILFRALGGDAGLRVAPAAEVEHGARRNWLARLAHAGEKVAQAARDEETLRLPAEIALFPERSLNRDLYLWLIAQGAALPAGGLSADTWIAANQQASAATLEAFPGFAARYRRLVAAVLAERPDPGKLPADEAAAERAIRQALDAPGSVAALPAARRPPTPVALWLYPAPVALDRRQSAADPTPAEHREGSKSADATDRRRQAQREDMPDGRNGLILPFRAESLLSFAEYVKVNRGHEEGDDEDPTRVARDMDRIAVARDGQDTASRVRFDLDLPSAAHDDIPLESGILLPEWDWKKQVLKKDMCSITVLDPRDAQPCPLPSRLIAPARRLRRQLESLTPARRWLKNQPDGAELDIDACVRAYADRRTGHVAGSDGGYLSCERRERDLCCLVLADLSLSTDTWVSDEQRVIDVIRDSLWLFSEALGATGDPFGLYGFSSRRREHIRFHRIKGFDEKIDDRIRGRIGVLKPGFYTRMGAAIRYATQILAKRPEALRLLMILSDGKPNDVDHYEGRYGIEDTRMSLNAARQEGVRPFCVTIDKEGQGYLPHLFGPSGYTILRNPADLPARLPGLYAQLTAG